MNEETGTASIARVDLFDWRRRIAELYARIRACRSKSATAATKGTSRDCGQAVEALVKDRLLVPEDAARYVAAAEGLKALKP
jgi:hypothetical protein